MAWMIASDENLDHLEHYGTPGMKWGVRNYIDKNGTLTAAGRERYRTSSGKYVQSEGLSNQKKAIEQARTSIKGLQGKENKAEKKKVQAYLKNQLKSYREASKSERKAYTEQKKKEREELKEEREGLKTVHQYTQYNTARARSVERLNKFTELIGRYTGKSAGEIKARKESLNAKAKGYRDDNERIYDQDIREATSKENVERFRNAMSGFMREKGQSAGRYGRKSSKTNGKSYTAKTYRR